MAKINTEAELLEKLKILDPEDDEQRNSLTCSLIGHSRIQDYFWGEFTCARCGDKVGDSLASIYPDADKVVVVGHDCDVCRSNYSECDWKDKIFTPDPFTKS